MPMDRHDIERLVKLEVQLEDLKSDVSNLEGKLDQQAAKSDARHAELVQMLAKVNAAGPNPVLNWVTNNWKALMILVALVSGGTALPTALELLNK